MATGKSSYFTLLGTKDMTAKCYWSETYNASTNTHVVCIEKICLISSNWYGFTYYPNGSVSVNGSSVVTFNSAVGSHHCRVDSQYDEYEIEAASGYSGSPWYSGTITGNDDGTCSATISLSFTGYTTDGKGANGFTVNASMKITLYTIARKSTISVEGNTLGSVIVITINRASSSFTHTVEYSFGSVTKTIVGTTTATTLNWNTSLSLASEIPSSTSGKMTLTCYTYNGSTLIGSYSYVFTVYLPDSVKPSVGTLTVRRVDGNVPSAWEIYVQKKSCAIAEITGAAGIYGSTISSYSIVGAGYTSTSDSLATSYLNTSGTITFTAKAMDSRGRWSDEQSVSIEVVPYSAPVFSSYSTQRCISSGTVSTNGTYGKGKVVFSFSSCDGRNTVTTSVAYKKASDSDYTDAGASFASGTEFVFGGGNLATDYTYDIRYTLTDVFGSVSVVDKLSTASVTMDFKAGGLGVAVGKVSETDKCFEIAEDWDVKMYGMLLEEYISSKASGGVYFCTCATEAATQAKVAACDGFKLVTGAMVAVKFTYTNTAGSPTININDTGAKSLVSYNNYVPTTYVWKPGQTVILIYDGSFYVALGTSYATTAYYGVTKLTSSTASTSTTLAATASAVKAAYDRCSWDSITLTNALGIAYGGTGATSAAGARSNLGISSTLLFSGTITTGSTSVAYGYKAYVIIGQPTSSGSRCAVIVPGNQLTTSAVAYQFADESYYYSFNMYYSGAYVYVAYKGRGSSGQILAIYGIN